MEYILLIIGFVLLIKGADIFVDGASSVAKLLKVPSVIIGLTIVSIGTSAPEAAVSISAGLAGSNDIAISNVIGSNIFNLMVVIGMCAVIKPFATDRDIAIRDLPINIGVTAILLLLLFDGTISRIDGAILLLLMVLYTLLLIVQALKNRDEGEDSKAMSPLKSILFIIIGLVAIIFGGDFVVDSAKQIALNFGMTETLVGLTIVAIGTSLPELVTSIVAATKGESGLALGNAVGSCIFNILLILGISSVLSPIEVAVESVIDTVILLGITALVFVFGFTSKKTTRGEAIVYLLIYAAYTAYIISRTYGLI